MAELFCREVDRNNPPRVRRPCRGLQRRTLAPSPKILCELLQHRENAPLIRQGCARLASFSAPDASYRMPWSAACITNTFESEFSVHTGGVPWTRLARRGLLAQAGAIGLVLVTGAFRVPGVAVAVAPERAGEPRNPWVGVPFARLRLSMHCLRLSWTAVTVSPLSLRF
jgi:hypothetical protein